MLSAENKIVHGLWIGVQLSPVELLCIRSFLANGHEFHLWTYDKIETTVPAEVITEDASLIIPREQAFSYRNRNQFGHGKGSYAGFSDIFRYKLLYEKGGWWVDMDVVCLRPLDFSGSYVFRTHHEFKVVGNLIKCPPESELMKRCHEIAVSRVTAENRDWNLPIRILNDAITELNLGSCIREFTNRDSWLYIRRLLLWKVRIPREWYAVHLVNEEWRRNRIDRKAILKGSQLGILLLRYGLWTPSPLAARTMNVLRLIFPRFSARQIRSMITGILRMPGSRGDH